jgi:VanZ family protein
LIIPIIYFFANWKPDHSRDLRKSAILIFSGILFATITEVYQIWIPGRAFNPIDLLLNNAGLLAGIPLGRIIRVRVESESEERQSESGE